MLDVDRVLARADGLARSAVAARVRANQLGLALSHLRRHQDVGKTLGLLQRLINSPFAFRTGSSPDQFRRLADDVKRALAGVESWQEAATIVGWARWLMAFYGARG